MLTQEALGERAAIVASIRKFVAFIALEPINSPVKHSLIGILSDLASGIEAGEHHKPLPAAMRHVE